MRGPPQAGSHVSSLEPAAPPGAGKATCPPMADARPPVPVAAPPEDGVPSWMRPPQAQRDAAHNTTAAPRGTRHGRRRLRQASRLKSRGKRLDELLVLATRQPQPSLAAPLSARASLASPPSACAAVPPGVSTVFAPPLPPAFAGSQRDAEELQTWSSLQPLCPGESEQPSSQTPLVTLQTRPLVSTPQSRSSWQPQIAVMRA